MGVFLFIVGIFLLLNLLPTIAGLVVWSGNDEFLDGFLTAWAMQFVLLLAIGLIVLMIWLIGTGWEMMHAPPEVY